jgi:IclR family acetate operon transcriptional repressor
LGCQQLAPVGDRHVVEQHAVVRLVHAELGLHRLGRQPDLAADDPASGGAPDIGIDPLHGVGALAVGGLQPVAKRRYGRASIGVAEPGCGVFQTFNHSDRFSRGLADSFKRLHRSATIYRADVFSHGETMRLVESARGAALLDKGLALFRDVVEDAGRSPLSSLADRAGIARSTAQRIVAVFIRDGLLSRTGRGRYAAGLRLADLAHMANRREVLVRASRPLLDRLARDIATTVHLGVLEGDMVTYLVKAHGGGPDLLTREDMQLEAYCSGIGKVLLAHMNLDFQNAYLANGPLVALTPTTITDPLRLRAEFQLTRRRGFAIDDAELQQDVYCLAVPVRGPGGKVEAALSASSRSCPAQDSLRLQRLRACAARIEARLGWRDDRLERGP